jgi:hypothetical protein
MQLTLAIPLLVAEDQKDHHHLLYFEEILLNYLISYQLG